MSRAPDRTVAAQTPVTGQFPAAFTLDIYAPPEANSLNDFTHGGRNPNESRIGVAYITVLNAGVVDIEDGADILGVVENFALVYIESDIKL